MMWLTWRQNRTQILIAVGGLAALAVIVLVTGPNLAHVYNTTVATCAAHNDCANATAAFLQNHTALQTGFGALLVVVPGIIGVFWGAPLISRELETGTYRLAWTQSVTRIRWLAVKVGIVGLASMTVAGVASLMVTWWSAPLDRVTMNPFGSFDERDVVPIAYAAFAFALGVTIGVLMRRTVPAMATTALAFAGTRLAVLLWVRPNLAAPLHVRVPDTLYLFGRPSTGNANPSDWVTSVQTVDGAGRVIGENGFIPGSGVSFGAGGHGITVGGVGSCPNIMVPKIPAGHANVSPGPYVEKCFDQLGVHDLLTYQPASRYWTFQWYELAIFIVLALLSMGICFWWVRRRLA
jgi:hypothetical protein